MLVDFSKDELSILKCAMNPMIQAARKHRYRKREREYRELQLKIIDLIPPKGAK